MEEYERIAREGINRQWNKGINPASYNGYYWFKKDGKKQLITPIKP